MSKKVRLDSLRADSSRVDELLRLSRKFEAPLAEFQLSQLKDSFDSEIDQLESTVPDTATVSLYFGGDPVLGSKGILAKFAGATIETFQELVSRVYAEREFGGLGSRGPVPLQHSTDLMLTDTVRGSFGFVLEEVNDQLDLEKSALKTMVEEVAEIIRKTSSDSEEEYQEVTDELDKRSLSSLAKFFKKLDESHSTLRIVEDEQDIALDHRSIDIGRRRTEATEISENEVTGPGRIIGLLPGHLRFEMRLDDGSEIFGSTTKAAAEKWVRYQYSNQFEANAVHEVVLNKREVRAVGKEPRTVYRLVDIKNIQ